jgi:hypothetical protein
MPDDERKKIIAAARKNKIRRAASLVFHAALYFFAAIGLVLMVGYFAVRFHFTDARGAIDLNNRYFAGSQGEDATLAAPQTASGTVSFNELALWCKLFAMKSGSPTDAERILAAYHETGSPVLALRMVESVGEHITTGTPLANSFSDCDAQWLNMPSTESGSNTTAASKTASAYPWIDTPEWTTLAEAITKDAPMINQVTALTDVPPRMIAAQLIGEQLRLYNTERELYKSAFAPLNILGSETQFSLGVTGIKPETAIAVEKNLADASSVYYPGSTYAHLLAFTTRNHATERYDRITDEHNHYYAYLYTALFIKEVEAQWTKAGYDISNRPEIISTLYNLGFAGSHPNADPQVGGTVITIGSTTYTFGSLGYEFYYSGELEDSIPYK